MAEVTVGTIEALKFSSGWGLVNVRKQSGSPPNELLIIWWGDESNGPAALFTTELTTALARGLTVRLTHGDHSAFIDAIDIRP
jgi:hypothetical protein